MKQRAFGKRSGFDVPLANIGGMRYPKDHDEAVKLIRHAIDSGMKYIDTSRGYSESEVKIGKALKDGYREKVILSTKDAPWMVQNATDEDATAKAAVKRIKKQLKQLDVDYLDFYQMWSMSNRKQYDQAIAPGGFLDGLMQAKKEGLIGHIGITTHDSVENLMSYIDEIDWCEVMLFSYNLLSTSMAPVIAKAHENGIGTIIMNPVGGGKLTEQSPVLLDIVEKVGCKSIPDMAIRYIASNPNIDSMINGIRNISEVDDTIASVKAGPLTDEQMKVIDDFQTSIAKVRDEGFCTGCGYCMPCPEGIEIPRFMSLVFDYKVWQFKNDSMNRYGWYPEPKPDACIRCGQCEEKCTQKLNIMDDMEWAAATLARNKVKD